jgi:protein TonB
MAPPAKVEGKQPATTLPADFSAWDGGEPEPPETLPDNFDDFDAAPKPPTKPATAQATVSRTVGRPPDTTAPRKSAKVYADVEEVSPPLQPKRLKTVESQKRKIEGESESKIEGKSEGRIEGKSEGKSKATVAFVAIGATVLLALGVLITMNSHKSAPKPAVSNQPVVTETTSSPTSPTPKPSPTPTLTPKPTPTPTEEAAPAPRVQSEMMNSQLNAPARISHDIKAMSDKDAPPASGFGATGIEGLGGNPSGGVGSVFSGKSGPRVTAEVSRTLNVSGGVMAGRLISRTNPVYPPLARAARVEGTVVLHATISKAGTIDNLNVVSGPATLRQAALDAVKTWRYRPYLLNNEPVAVETTVNVIFQMGG